MSFIRKMTYVISKTSREKKINHFYSYFQAGESVLDAGVSRALKWRSPISNLFLKTYRYDPGTYTGLGVENMTGMDKLYPGKRFIQYPGGEFPFPNNAFDWVFSNAVIEHVGDDNAQRLFLNEMLRVGRKVFFTTPNKFFPVESHTGIFFLHWHDNLFTKWRIKHAARITRSKINLLSYRDLKLILKESNATSYRIYKNRFAGLPMTFTVICETI
jgi:hypothetical protein